MPTGGNDVIHGGTGSNTLDLSLLPSYSTFNLGSAAPQQLGTGDGTLDGGARDHPEGDRLAER